MSEEIKKEAVELTDEEAENAAGGTWPSDPDFLTKKCGKCQTIFDYNLTKCPNCQYDKGEVLAGGECNGSFPQISNHGGPH